MRAFIIRWIRFVWWAEKLASFDWHLAFPPLYHPCMDTSDRSEQPWVYRPVS